MQMKMIRQSYEREDYNSAIKKITTDLILGKSHKIRATMSKDSARSGILASNPFTPDDLDDHGKESVLDESFNQPSEVDHQENNRSKGKHIFDLLESGTNEEIFNCIENLLMDYKIDQIINSNGLGLLHVACENNNLDLVHFLLDKAEELEGK